MIKTRWTSWAFAASLIGCSAANTDESNEALGAPSEQDLASDANYYVGPWVSPEGHGEAAVLDEDGNLRNAKYLVRGGMAVVDGDIVLGTVEEVHSQAKGFQQVSGLWPRRTVPYTFNTNLTAAQKADINTAITAWNTALGVVFKPRTTQSDYVEFVKFAGVCDSPVGRKGGKQQIRLADGGCPVPSIMHELGHTLNLQHEHQRWDAPNFIDVHEDRALDAKVEWLKPIAQSSANRLIGANLDFSSIMLYDSFAFAALADGVTECSRGTPDCKPTLTKKGTENTWVKNSTLSATDIRAVRGQYNVFENPSVKTSVALYTDIRWFSGSTTNKTQFCKDNGYSSAAASESLQSLPAGTVTASWNTATRKWEASSLPSAVQTYLKITCNL